MQAWQCKVVGGGVQESTSPTARAPLHVRIAQAILGFCNWLAPSHLKASFTQCNTMLLGAMTADSPHAMALVLQPIHSNIKGKVWEQSNLLMKAVTAQNLNIDYEFSILVSDVRDKRDGRPAVYHGRIAYGLGHKDLRVQVW